MAGIDVKVAWSYITKDGWGQFVMTSGTFLTPRLCAGSWDVARPLQLQEALTLDKARVISCWTTCSAAELRSPCRIVITLDGGYTTVATMKTLVLSAQVLSLFSFLHTFAINYTQYTCVSMGVCRHSPPEITFHSLKTHGGKLYQTYQIYV